MGVKLSSKAIVAEVTKQHTKSGVAVSDTASSEQLRPVVVSEPFATVAMSMGMTKNLGNYEALKVNIHLSMPSAPDFDSIAQTANMVREWVENKLDDILKEATE